jgi:hypothetical protein
MYVGAGVGVVLGASLLLPIHLSGLPFFIAVGMAKLTFISALGLIGGGAWLRRLARREDERRQLAAPPPDE